MVQVAFTPLNVGLSDATTERLIFLNNLAISIWLANLTALTISGTVGFLYIIPTDVRKE